MCVCCMLVCMNRSTCMFSFIHMCTHVCGDQWMTLDVFLNPSLHSILKQSLRLGPWACDWSGTTQNLAIELSYVSASWALWIGCPSHLACACMLEIWTLILRLEQKPVLSTEPSPSLWNLFLLRMIFKSTSVHDKTCFFQGWRESSEVKITFCSFKVLKLSSWSTDQKAFDHLFQESNIFFWPYLALKLT